jgi:hypothetical protein
MSGINQFYKESLTVVGTSKAVIFCFDMMTKKAQVFSKGRNVEYERVDTLCVADNGEYVIAGYALGQVTIWNLEKYEVKKNIIGVFVASVSLIRILETATTTFLAADPSGLLMKFSIVPGYFTNTLEQASIFKSGASILDFIRQDH